MAEPIVAIVHSDPDPVIKALAGHGFKGIACPALTIRHLNVSIDAAHYDAAVLTSAHALKSIQNSGLPVYAVGPQTAEAAMDAGLKILGAGNGDANDLLALPDLHNKKLLHPCGRDLSPGTRKVLAALDATDVCVYEADAANPLVPALLNALEAKQLHAVMGFSMRGMHGFTDAVKQGTNLHLWRGVRGVALSTRIASAMEGVPYAEILVAAHPNRNAILEALVS